VIEQTEQRPTTAPPASEPTTTGSSRKFIGDIVSTTVVQAVQLPLSLVTSIVIARTLAPAGKGAFTSIVSISEFALLFGGQGIGKAATYLIARYREQERAFLAATMVLSIAGAAVVSAGVILFVVVPMRTLLPTLPVASALFAAPLAAGTLVRTSLEGILRADQRNHAVNVVALIFTAGGTGLVVVLAATHDLTLSSALASRTAIVAAVLVLLVVFLRRLPWRSLWHYDRASGGRIMRYGGPYALVSLTQNLNYDLDVLLVQGMMSSASVGIYSVGVSTAELVWVLPFAVGFVILPRAAAGQDEASGVRLVVVTARRTVLLAAVAAILLAGLAFPLIHLMYGSRYGGAVGPALILLPGIVMNSWYQVFGGFLMGRGHMKHVLVATTIGVTVNAALNVALIPVCGIDGAALSSAVSYTLTSLFVIRGFYLHWGRQRLVPTCEDARVMLAGVRTFAGSAYRAAARRPAGAQE